jgi:thiol:disulfide interchange protein DsbD
MHAVQPVASVAATVLALLGSAQSSAALQQQLHARVALQADHAAVQPGQTLHMGLRIAHDAGWHTYWINPGDSGLATRFDWQLQNGTSVSGIRWPYPERLPFGPLTNFGYSNDLLLPVALTVPVSAKVGERLTVSLRARWLICAEICIPDEATLVIDLPIEAKSRASAQATDFVKALARVPKLLSAVQGHAWRDATHVAAQIQNAAWAKDAARIEIFPLTPQVLASDAIEARLSSDGTLRFRHTASDAFDRMPEKVSWVVGVYDRDGAMRSVEFSVPGDDARAPPPSRP